MIANHIKGSTCFVFVNRMRSLYLNELKIVGAPSNLIGKKVRLTFSQENTTGKYYHYASSVRERLQASPFAKEGLFAFLSLSTVQCLSGGKCDCHCWCGTWDETMCMFCQDTMDT